MGEYRSTDEVAEATGATYRQLDHWVRRGIVRPLLRHSTTADGEAFGRKWDDRRWRPVDVAAAAAVVALVAPGPGREADLARLAAEACYAWHGVAPWVVVALPAVQYAAWSAEEVVALVDGLTVATVVGTAA